MKLVFPFTPVDQELAVKLSSWIVELGPNLGHSCLLLRDVRVNPNHYRSILHNVQKVFTEVETADVPEKLDGWPLAPNTMFRHAAKHIQLTKPEPWLWIEADALPLKEGWMETLAKEYDADPRKPFLGDFVNVPNVEPHMSGIGVYPGMLIDYAPSATYAQDMAWDVFASHEIVPKMKQTAFIKHRWKHPPFQNMSQVDNLLAQLGDAVLFHADKSGTLIDFLREKRGGPKATGVLTLPEPKNDSTGLPAPTKATTDIFIKTCEHDKEWLEWNQRSIRRFVSGVNSVVIKDSEKGDDGYLWQQVVKMYADTYCKADYILFIDSDTIFTRNVTPGTYLLEGKPIWMITPIDQAHPNEAHAWRGVMRKFMGKDSEFEFMRRFPFLVPRWALEAFRGFCVQQHGVELEAYIMAQPYREFSEFNCLGFYLWEFHRDKFHWINTGEVPEKDWPILTVDQEWSHNPIPVEKWEKILSGGSSDKASEAPAEPSPGSVVVRTDARGDLPPSQSSGNGNESYDDPIEAVKRMFTSPLAKGRIIKKLKSAPVLK